MMDPATLSQRARSLIAEVRRRNLDVSPGDRPLCYYNEHELLVALAEVAAAETERADRAEAGAAALREVIERHHYGHLCRAVGADRECARCIVLATEAGSSLLARLREAEQERDRLRDAIRAFRDARLP